MSASPCARTRKLRSHSQVWSACIAPAQSAFRNLRFMEVRSPAFAALEWKSIQRLRRGTAGKNDACGSPAARRTHGRLWRAPKAPPGGGRCEPQASSGRRPSGRPAGGRPSPEPGSPGRGGTPADLRRHTHPEEECQGNFATVIRRHFIEHPPSTYMHMHMYMNLTENLKRLT